MKILAIESSCDETAAAIVEKKSDAEMATVLAEQTLTSIALHQQTKGIIPELAAREQLKGILPVLQAVQSQIEPQNNSLASLLHQIDCLAVSTGPGLIGSLLVGVETARTLSWLGNNPIIPVNHVAAHPYAHFIASSAHKTPPQFPLLSWTISGGHTELSIFFSHQQQRLLGNTVDDAVGECLDKCARVIGGEYPGGPYIQQMAEQWQPATKMTLPSLPRPMLTSDNFKVSFSGLKTAFARAYNQLHTNQLLPAEQIPHYLAWELLHAISDVLIKKTELALKKYPDTKSICVSGGVAANTFLKQQFFLHFPQVDIFFPTIAWSTDNAAMIGAYASFHLDEQRDWQEIHAFC